MAPGSLIVLLYYFHHLNNEHLHTELLNGLCPARVQREPTNESLYIWGKLPYHPAPTHKRQQHDSLSSTNMKRRVELSNILEDGIE